VHPDARTFAEASDTLASFSRLGAREHGKRAPDEPNVAIYDPSVFAQEQRAVQETGIAGLATTPLVSGAVGPDGLGLAAGIAQGRVRFHATSWHAARQTRGRVFQWCPGQRLPADDRVGHECLPRARLGTMSSHPI
jgi:hypothetical protein